MFFKDFVSEEFGNFNNFVERKYVLSETAFTRKGKLSLKAMIKYPLCNRKKTTSIEVNRFLRNELNDRGVTITKQAISEKRQFIDPIVYIDMNDSFISKIYAHQDEMASFKGFHVCAIDSSIVEIPNTKLTRKEFEIPEKTQPKKDTSSARISCLVDTHWDFVISSNLTNKKVNELTNAIIHLDDAKDKIDLKKTITTYDRGYNFTELMVKTIQLESYFLIRAKKSTFKKKQSVMETKGINDATFRITLNKVKIDKFNSEDLKKYAEKIRDINVRIVKVKLKNGTIETLLTNLPKEIATPEELKQLYGERWKIETDYDRLKNKLYIEKFSGRRRTIIEQDFYSHIFLLNLLIGIKHDAELKITRKPKETAKYTYEYHSNINTLIGEIKDQLPRLLTDNQDEIQKVIKEIMEIGSKELVATKIPARTHAERDKERNWNKNCKTSKSQGF